MTATRRLAAILAADVAGYSRLIGADEQGTLTRLKAIRSELIDPQMGAHHGRIVKTTGDGLLVEFGSTVDALRCASEVQTQMAERNAAAVPEDRIEWRIGIHQGDIVVEDGDIFGDGVNIAARLEGLAQPGGVCVSARVQEDAAGKIDLAFEDLGEQQLKNIARPVHVYATRPTAAASTLPDASPRESARARGFASRQHAVIAAVLVAVIGIATAVWWAWPQRNVPTAAVPTATPQSLPGSASIAVPRLSFVVLPFENLSRDPDQEYFADGITDDLTTDLSRISGSFVIARNTAFTYKGKADDVKQIGRELGVHYVIEGSVRLAGNQVQVNVQLIDAETGAHLWADRFNTDRQDLAEAQSEITGRLARTLNIQLLRDVDYRIEQEKTVNPDARDLVMRGWAQWHRQYSMANYQEAQRTFEQALALDPRSVEAKIGLGAALAANVGNGWSSSVKQDEARAEELLVDALGRDPNSSMAHFGMSALRGAQNRLAEAHAEAEAAVALDHNNANAEVILGIWLNWLGRPQAGIPHIEKGILLSPHDPHIGLWYFSLGHAHLLLNQVDQAIDLFRKASTANPRMGSIHLFLAGALGLRGDLDEARAELAESLRLKPDINSFAAQRAAFPANTNPEYWALAEKTVNLGLRRAGFPRVIIAISPGLLFAPIGRYRMRTRASSRTTMQLRCKAASTAGRLANSGAA
jgi:TolB-like protein/class 3 adenylate cyclase